MRINKSFRFSIKSVKLLELLAKDNEVSLTKTLEDLILKEAVKRGLED